MPDSILGLMWPRKTRLTLLTEISLCSSPGTRKAYRKVIVLRKIGARIVLAWVVLDILINNAGGIAIMAAIFAAHGSYATHATFFDGFRPAEWAAAGASALGVIAAALAPSKSRSADRATAPPKPTSVRQPA